MVQLNNYHPIMQWSMYKTAVHAQVILILCQDSIRKKLRLKEGAQMAGVTKDTQLSRVSLRNSVCITTMRKTSVISVEHRTYVINMMLA